VHVSTEAKLLSSAAHACKVPLLESLNWLALKSRLRLKKVGFWSRVRHLFRVRALFIQAQIMPCSKARHTNTTRNCLSAIIPKCTLKKSCVLVPASEVLQRHKIFEVGRNVYLPWAQASSTNTKSLPGTYICFMFPLATVSFVYPGVVQAFSKLPLRCPLRHI
jgi:hypothetical protein